MQQLGELAGLCGLLAQFVHQSADADHVGVAGHCQTGLSKHLLGLGDAVQVLLVGVGGDRGQVGVAIGGAVLLDGFDAGDTSEQLCHFRFTLLVGFVVAMCVY